MDESPVRLKSIPIGDRSLDLVWVESHQLAQLEAMSMTADSGIMPCSDFIRSLIGAEHASAARFCESPIRDCRPLIFCY